MCEPQDSAGLSAPDSSGAPQPPLEASLRELTALAARLSHMPMAVLTLADSERQWCAPAPTDVLKAGLERSCRVWAGAEDLHIPDTRLDPRFADDPMVTGEPWIGSYAGVTLRTPQGAVAGTLCVLGPAPKALTRDELHDLHTVARQMSGQLELQRQVDALSTEVSEATSAHQAVLESEQRWRAMVEHSPIAVAVINDRGRFAYVNPRAVRLLGASDGSQLVGMRAKEFVPVAVWPQVRNQLTAVLKEGMPVQARRGALRQIDGRLIPIELDAVQVMQDSRPAVQIELRDVGARIAAELALQASERRFRAVFDGSPVAMSLSDGRGLWVVANPAFGRLLGVAEEDLVGKSALEYTHPDDLAKVAASEQGQRDSPDGVLRMELRLLRPTGELRWALMSITPTPGPQGEPWTLSIAMDITDRKAAEMALRTSEANLAAIATVARSVRSGTDPRPIVVAAVRSLAEAATVCLWEAGTDGRLQISACDGIDLTGYSVSPGESSFAGRVWQTGEPAFLAQVAAGALVNPELRALVRPVSALWQPVVVEGEVIAVLSVTWQNRVSDIYQPAAQAVQVLAAEAGASLQAAQLRAELERLASTDPLTGALNRRAWETELAAMTERSRVTAQPLTVALIDLDEFKAYNDAFGHMAGDAVLRDFAANSRSRLRGGDLFARWGGEEFIAALPGCSGALASAILERLRLGMPGTLTCSIGHTIWDVTEPISVCVARADSALYAAKRGGRNQVVAG